MTPQHLIRFSVTLMLSLGFSQEVLGMFVEGARKRINFKVVLLSPNFDESAREAQAYHTKLPADSKDKVRSVSSGSVATLFFDFRHHELQSYQNHEVRLHLYSLSGKPESESARASQEFDLLKGADAIVVSVPCDEAGRCDESQASRARENFEKLGYDWNQTPVVYQVQATGKNGEPGARALENKIKAPNKFVVREGLGIDASIRKVLAPYKAGGVALPPPIDGDAEAGKGRFRLAALVQFYKDKGASRAETISLHQGQNVYVLGIPPSGDRPSFTYATAGLFKADKYELVAEVSDATDGIAEILTRISAADWKPETIALDERTRTSFLLVPYSRWRQQVAETGVEFLQAVPLAPEEAEFGAKHGVPALAKRLAKK